MDHSPSRAAVDQKTNKASVMSMIQPRSERYLRIAWMLEHAVGQVSSYN